MLKNACIQDILSPLSWLHSLFLLNTLEYSFLQPASLLVDWVLPHNLIDEFNAVVCSLLASHNSIKLMKDTDLKILLQH